MNEWMDEWMNEWMDEWMNEWMNERINKWNMEWHENGAPLILFNVFSRSFSDDCTDFLIFWQDHFKDFSNYKLHWSGERIKKNFVNINYKTKQVRKCLLLGR